VYYFPAPSYAGIWLYQSLPMLLDQLRTEFVEQAKRKRFDDMLRETDKLIKARQYDEAIKFVQQSLYAKQPKALKLIEQAKRKRFDDELFKANKLIKARQYDEAINLVQQTQYATDPKALEVIDRAKYQRKKAQENNILANLQQWPSTQVEKHIKAYTNLIKLFPDNKEYQRKLRYYKKKRAELRRQPPLFIIQEDYGEKWPFTLPNGELECYHPGIVTFKANGTTYAVNGLAKSRGYSDIDDIWKIAPNINPNKEGLQGRKMDIGNIIKKGLELCNPQ
ncbi:DUF2511 domain-containing protein, partial [Candidatus Marithioploca araucensis]|nr:DUF2511 domain-containing protein [Candidatus Marithioploca araucensis]